MVSKTDIELKADPLGGLHIWAHPEPGRKYVIGADTAAGLSLGDYAVGAVIDGETCALVAGMRERHHPHLFGKELAWLGWWYNDAVLAIETYPSSHGATAAQIARALGYPNIYARRTQMKFVRKVTDDIGWRTDGTTKPQMIDRVKIALEDGCPIPEELLLQELREQRRDEKGEMVSSGHDDYVIAYAIALKVRDECWSKGELRVVPKAPVTDSERYWARVEAQSQGQRRERRRFSCG